MNAVSKPVILGTIETEVEIEGKTYLVDAQVGSNFEVVHCTLTRALLGGDIAELEEKYHAYMVRRYSHAIHNAVMDAYEEQQKRPSFIKIQVK